jgi:2-iminobutanoate/2-iminopropanoate deaminase
MIEKINTEKAPSAIGPYSQALKVGNVLYISGQTPVNPTAGKIESDAIGQQAEQVMKNLGAILESQGMDYSNVVKTTCFLVDMTHFSGFNEVYGKYFTGKPARSCVAVKEIPLGSLCEVEAIAVK